VNPIGVSLSQQKDKDIGEKKNKKKKILVILEEVFFRGSEGHGKVHVKKNKKA